jgi:mannose-1-phosphate guanylyltransferase
LIEEAKISAPDIAEPALKAAQNMKHSDDFYYLDEKQFAAAKSLSIDFAVLERTSKAAVLPSHFPWSDLGTWKSVHAILPQDENGNAAVGKTQITHSKNVLVLGDDRLVAVEGLENVVVSVTPDAILVAHLDTSAKMKLLVEKLKADHPHVLKMKK